MKIIALADVHGDIDRAEDILAGVSDADVVVIGGDLTTRADPSEAEAAIERFRSDGRPVVAVAGNMDLPAVEERYRRLGISLDSNGVIIDGIGFFGVSGCPPTPMMTPYEISEEEMARRIEIGWGMTRHASRTVFVPHTPPRATTLDRISLGAHVGSTSVRNFIDREQPDLVICGHIHEARGIEKLGTTTVVNCGPGHQGFYALIEVGENVRAEIRRWPE
jgi:Icc-related predicted phosphoesterase